MKKILLALLTLTFAAAPSFSKVTGPFGYDLEKDIHRSSNKTTTPPATPVNTTNTTSTTNKTNTANETKIEPEWLKIKENYYPNANLNNAIRKYKQQNYSGALQELISLTKKDPSNPLVYYYLGMAYTQVGNKEQAQAAYEKVLDLNADKTLSVYATRGRDCLTGGEFCKVDQTQDSTLDDFINAPYGNGFSDEINKQEKEKRLKKIQQTINEKQDLEYKDIKNIQDFDHKSEAITQDKIATAPSNDDIINAIDVLKRAGITVSVNPYGQQSVPMDSEYAQLNMLLGNNNNNNNSMMNMLPLMLSQNQSGKNLDPQVFQAMMMNSMMPDFAFDNDKKY